MGRDGKAEYAARRIPGARHWDLDATDDPSDLPHMLPSPGFFADSMAALGVTSDDHIVAYDGKGIFSARRGSGGACAPSATTARRCSTAGCPRGWARATPSTRARRRRRSAAAARFDAALRPEAVWTRAQVAANLQDRAALVVDARALARFEGRAPEPRANCRSGRIPGAAACRSRRSSPRTARMKAERRAARRLRRRRRRRAAAPLALSCGSGVTASVLALALDQLGVAAPVYDGSAAEWLSRDDTPIETGPVEEA